MQSWIENHVGALSMAWMKETNECYGMRWMAVGQSYCRGHFIGTSYEELRMQMDYDG